MIAALYVVEGGPYEIKGIDPWDKKRDARKYKGPHPVIAHPPCERWGRYWGGGPSAKVKRKLGDDEGCFQAALQSVRKFGGVLEQLSCRQRLLTPNPFRDLLISLVRGR